MPEARSNLFVCPERNPNVVNAYVARMSPFSEAQQILITGPHKASRGIHIHSHHVKLHTCNTLCSISACTFPGRHVLSTLPLPHWPQVPRPQLKRPPSRVTASV